MDAQLSQASDVCVISAAQNHGVPADLMLAVRSIERGRPGGRVQNTNGTSDFNEPGINTRTLEALDRKGWEVDRLMNDGCYAMQAASYWMRIKLLDAVSSDEPLLARAARYHSRTFTYNIAYQGKLKTALRTWACHLSEHWKVSHTQLFALSSGVMSEKELTTCKPQLNPY